MKEVKCENAAAAATMCSCIKNGDKDSQLRKLDLECACKKVLMSQKVTNDLQEMAENTRRSKIRQSTLRFIRNTSIHGLPRVLLTANKCIQFFWLCLLLSSAIGGVYTLYINFADFMRYEVITKTELLNESVGSTVFPAVTVCRSSSTSSKNEVGRRGEEEEEEGMMLRGLVQKCVYSGKNCEFDKDFDEFTNELGLLCLRFNAAAAAAASSSSSTLKVLRKTQGITSKYGLQIEFLMPNANETLHVYVSENDINYFGEMHAYNVGTNLVFNIYFAKHVIRKLPMPYNECTEKLEVGYRKKNCMQACIHSKVASLFNCSLPGFYSDSRIRREDENMKDSRRPGCDGFVSERGNSKKKKFVSGVFSVECSEKCPQECTSISYDTSVYTNNRRQNGKEKHILLSLYFRTLDYLEYSQIPKTDDFGFISIIGGTLGFYLGVSLQSIFDVLQFLMEICRILSFGYIHHY